MGHTKKNIFKKAYLKIYGMFMFSLTLTHIKWLSPYTNTYIFFDTYFAWTYMYPKSNLLIWLLFWFAAILTELPDKIWPLKRRIKVIPIAIRKQAKIDIFLTSFSPNFSSIKVRLRMQPIRTMQRKQTAMHKYIIEIVETNPMIDAQTSLSLSKVWKGWKQVKM